MKILFDDPLLSNLTCFDRLTLIRVHRILPRSTKARQKEKFKLEVTMLDILTLSHLCMTCYQLQHHAKYLRKNKVLMSNDFMALDRL